MSTLAIVATVWLVLCFLLVWGNKRWQDRMHRMDADMEQANAQWRLQRSYDAVDYSDR
jgi:preprotein translocase subunit SecG